MDRNTYFLLSLLCLGLNRFYSQNCLQPDSTLHAELAGIMRLPMYDRGRDADLLFSRMIRNSGFIRDVFVLGSLLMISAIAFYRGLHFERARPFVPIPVPPEQNNSQNQTTDLPTQQPASAAQGPSHHSSAFFQTNVSSSSSSASHVEPANTSENNEDERVNNLLKKTN